MTEKIAAGEICPTSSDGKHHFIDWRDTSREGPDFCASCQLYDPNDPKWPLAKPAEAGSVESVVYDTGMPEDALSLPVEQLVTDEATGDVPEEFKRNTVVPIPTETLREYFTNKQLFFIVNHSESKLKGAAFLTYLTNLNIPSDVTFNEPLSYEEYAEIMKAHFEQASIHNCARVHVMAAEIMLMAKGLPYIQSPYALPIDPQFPFQFIGDNMELVSRWVDFIDSAQVYALHSIKALADHYKPAEKFEVVDDKNFVGANAAMLYRLPHFAAAYFAVPNAEYKLSFYTQQFNEYMFKNDRLAKFFGAKNNFVALIFGAFAQGIFTAKEMEGSHMFSIGAFDPKHMAYTAEPYVYKPAQD